MSKKEKFGQSVIGHEEIQNRIYLIRNKRVMIDKDLSILYGVTTKVLNQAVKRNPDRFPGDFMFQLNREESISRSQIVTLKHGQHIKYLPYAFTEQGVAMLSSVLNSKAAIWVNIGIIRTFVKMRELAESHRDLWLKIDEMEKRYNHQFRVVFKAVKMLLEKDNDAPPKRF